jgi:hypothetical protein
MMSAAAARFTRPFRLMHKETRPFPSGKEELSEKNDVDYAKTMSRFHNLRYEIKFTENIALPLFS